MKYQQSAIEKAIKENLTKNLLVVIICVLFYNTLFESLSNIQPEGIGDFLMVVSILLVTVSFACFAFTYEKTHIYSLGTRLLAHSATFIFMLLIGLLLESMVISIRIIYPSLHLIILFFSMLLYLGIALYDFWDLFRLSQKAHDEETNNKNINKIAQISVQE